LVNKGFKNEGVKKVLSQVPPKVSTALRGVSIGVTNKPYGTYGEMLENLLAGFKDAESFDTFDYYELNISCPNLRNIKNLTEQLASPDGLRQALELISHLTLKRPVFIKMSLERSPEEMDKLIDAARPFAFVRGLIFSNLVKDRTNKAFDREEIENAGAGNFSGKPVEEQSNSHLCHAYTKCKDRFVLIGTGGVFSAEDAYKKIRSGATLVQLITGMVYQGPQVIGEINSGLVKLLARDGFTQVGQAIGVDA
jgi:dihydroorotate dehydrogenase